MSVTFTSACTSAWRTGLCAVAALAFFALAPGIMPEMAAAAQHLWMAGAIGLMTLAVMTRASLGHSGRPLHATKPIAALYIALIVAVLARFASGALPGEMWPLRWGGCIRVCR